MRSFLERLIEYLPYPMMDYLRAKFIMRVCEGWKVVYENEAFYVFDNECILYKIHFQDVCDARGLDWMVETERLYQQYFKG